MHSTSESIAPQALSPALDKRTSRRKFLRRMISTGAVLGVGAIYATQIEPFWLDVHPVDVPIANLPAAFEGFRIAHLTDLHAGESVPISHLRRAVDRVNALSPDCVVVTGDLVTHDPDWIEPISQVLSQLRAPVYVTFGNHDYDPTGAMPGSVTIIADPLEQTLSRLGCTVLRNRSIPIARNNQRLWLTGLEDLYTTRFLPAVAFKDVPMDEPKICLSHNPDGTKRVAAPQARPHPQRPHPRRPGPPPILGRHHPPHQRQASGSGAIRAAVWTVIREQGGWIPGEGSV